MLVEVWKSILPTIRYLSTARSEGPPLKALTIFIPEFYRLHPQFLVNGSSFWIVPLDVSLLTADLLCLMPVVWVGFLIRRTLEQRRTKSKSPFTERFRQKLIAAKLLNKHYYSGLVSFSLPTQH
jgi:hypothetical protein